MMRTVSPDMVRAASTAMCASIDRLPQLIHPGVTMEEIPPHVSHKPITVELVHEIRIHCNLTCTEAQKAACIWYGHGDALKQCKTIRDAEAGLRQRVGC